VECKLRCINFRGVSDHGRAFWPAFRVTAISDDWFRSTMGVIVISLRTPRSTGENFACTLKHLGAQATSLGALTTSLGALTRSLGALMTSLGAPTTSLGAPGSTSNKPGSTSNHSKAVLEKRHLLWERCWWDWKS